MNEIRNVIFCPRYRKPSSALRPKLEWSPRWALDEIHIFLGKVLREVGMGKLGLLFVLCQINFLYLRVDIWKHFRCKLQNYGLTLSMTIDRFIRFESCSYFCHILFCKTSLTSFKPLSLNDIFPFIHQTNVMFNNTSSVRS